MKSMAPVAGRGWLSGRGWLWSWAVVAVAAFVMGGRLLRLPWSHLAGAPAPTIEDRRQYHFRNFTYSQTQRLVDGLLRQAYSAPSPRERAIALARVAIVQRERGMDEAAAAAAREAMQLGGGDAAVRTILASPLRLEDIVPRQ